ncbi:MerR family transcriptional regulator [Georgenia sp. TF02-10]|uniref:MerR family transcriptional regulator n=1 Tax=Georgenia sp. TF02-10 TaxID=2917725 RepID=UPI001FA7B486|nr:MerR family transcriptional regulator [Georgenia sp. TF02-10]UNX55188.1 MerR family transcriptional regulator [Georgenia sp. TF02-10]
MSRASGTDRLLRVGELAALTGVSARLLRYYDNQGLLAAERSPTGQRLFHPAAAEQVRYIRSLLEAGLPTRVIGELIDCIYEPGRIEPCAVPTLVEHLNEHDQRIAGMLSTRAALQGLIDSSSR